MTISTMHYSIILLLLSTEVAAYSFVAPPPRTVISLQSSKKDIFLDSLTHLDALNDGIKESTKLLNDMVDEKTEVDVKTLLSSSSTSTATLSVANPGALSSILPIAPGNWKVIYAPHMTTIAKLAGGVNLDVQYIMHGDQTIESHARFSNLPFLQEESIYLSVSGTYNSVSDTVCSVEWTEAWVKIIHKDDEDVPYAQITNVPDSFAKNFITKVGKLIFIQPFSIFPVSFLSEDLTVFDFELLGTRICARKVAQE